MNPLFNFTHTDTDKGTLEWRSPSNIALIKYWGKHGEQKPINPSVSMTLKYAFTQTEIHWSPKSSPSAADFEFFLSQQKVGEKFEKRVGQLIKIIAAEYPKINEDFLTINSINTFPHSTGIASSASGLSALALALMSLGKRLHGQDLSYDAFLQKASYYARLGSGSACRSVYAPYAIWGAGATANSTNDFAIPFTPHNDFLKIHDSILIFSKTPKTVSSSAGHELMNNHAYKQGRIAQANENTQNMLEALKSGDFEKWQHITENEALALHGLMLSSVSPVLQLLPDSIQFLTDFMAFRKGKGLKAAFTIDAGPNIHILYAPEHYEEVRAFISNWITERRRPIDVIDDETGKGAKELF
jgi:diphosphomevalonate decarboxylase